MAFLNKTIRQIHRKFASRNDRNPHVFHDEEQPVAIPHFHSYVDMYTHYFGSIRVIHGRSTRTSQTGVSSASFHSPSHEHLTADFGVIKARKAPSFVLQRVEVSNRLLYINTCNMIRLSSTSTSLAISH